MFAWRGGNVSHRDEKCLSTVVLCHGYLLNFVMTCMFLCVGYGVYNLVGWSDSPLYFRMLTVLIGFPYMVALIDCIINSAKPSVKAFVNLILLTPVFLSASLWFYVWFPCCELVSVLAQSRCLLTDLLTLFSRSPPCYSLDRLFRSKCPNLASVVGKPGSSSRKIDKHYCPTSRLSGPCR